MSDWSTPPPSGAFPAPAEGLPPCMERAVVFEGRQVTRHNKETCRLTEYPKYKVVAGTVAAEVSSCTSSLHEVWPVVLVRTNDPAEAQAAFERGAEWVRMGTGP